jgi:hypothetical protein
MKHIRAMLLDKHPFEARKKAKAPLVGGASGRGVHAVKERQGGSGKDMCRKVVGKL